MSNRNSNGKSNIGKKTVVPKKNGKYIIIGLSVIIAAAALIFIIKGLSDSNRAQTQASSINAETVLQGGDISIVKSDITETAKFIPYKSGNTNMEVLAVKAPDGTVRTAFNTCQVCYNSRRGYYKQEGDELVCQNCGNRFKISAIEKEKNGCNPVPILEGDKVDNGTTITISKDFLNQNVGLFGKWKKG